MGKEIPDEKFPHTNDPVAYKKRVDTLVKSLLLSAFKTLTIIVVVVYGVAFHLVPWYYY